MESLLAAILLVTSSAAGATCPPSYSYCGYSGPAQWRYITEWSSCGGQVQSPVNLRGWSTNNRGPFIDVNYARTASAVVSNTGHDIEVAPSPGGAITISGKSYTLTQFHFHVPSEHQFVGKSSPAE